jgi:hypothetical protein
MKKSSVNFLAISLFRMTRHVRRVIIALMCIFVTSSAHAYTVKPADGGWGIDGEEVLAVGRGFNLETSNNIVIVTFYGYDASRRATFYVGGGVLGANNVAQVPLSESRNGPCFGCSITSGVILGSPGTLTFEFITSTTGFITIPGEGRKAITKANMTWSFAGSDLLGTWTFTYFNNTGGTSVSAENISLTKTDIATATGAGIASDASGQFGCEQQVRGFYAGYTVCVRVTTSGATERTYLFKRFGHAMDGAWTLGNVVPDKFAFAKRWNQNGSLPTLKSASDIDVKVSEKLRAAIQAAASEQPATLPPH